MPLHIDPSEVGTADYALERQQHYRRMHSDYVKQQWEEAQRGALERIRVNEARSKEERERRRADYARRMSELKRAQAEAKERERRNRLEEEQRNQLRERLQEVKKTASFVTVDMIVKATALVFKVTPEHIFGKNRLSATCRVRHIAMFLSCRLTQQSTTQIGLRFKKDHTTIMHGRDKIERDLATDDDLRLKVAEIEGLLR